jgi:hypothetical protein
MKKAQETKDRAIVYSLLLEHHSANKSPCKNLLLEALDSKVPLSLVYSEITQP